MGKKIILSAFLVMVILVSSVYFVLNDEVRIDIQKTKSIFQVYENGEWVVSGVEYVNLFDGTAKMRAKNRSLETIIGENNITTITRIANYKDGISTIETYIFNPNVEDVELFPISHSINVINGEDKLLQYEVQKLLYTGDTIKDILSPQKFGHKMVVEWEGGNYYSKIYKYKNKNEGKLTIKYRIDSANYLKNVRLFDPSIEITTWAELQAVNDNLTESYILMNDLNNYSTGYNTYASSTANSGAGWLPLGNSTTNFNFEGIFNGQNYTISNLYINRTDNYMALFGYITSATIYNLGVLDSNITGGYRSGTIIGSSNGPITAYHLWATGVLNGGIESGGLIGSLNDNNLSDSWTNVSISGNRRIGGFIGDIQGNAYLTNCYSLGSVNGNVTAGGFVGDSSNGPIFTNCYSNGAVSGNSDIGGFSGTTTGIVTANDIFWDTQTSGQATSSLGTGKTTAQMKDFDTFDPEWNISKIINSQVRNTSAIWNIVNGSDYPFFSWKELATISLVFTTIPVNDSVDYKTNWDGVNFKADDSNPLFGFYAVNDSRFTINSTGFLNKVSILGVENYYLNITINDTSDNLNYTIYNINVTKSSLSGNLTNTKTWIEEDTEEITIGLSESNIGDDDVTYIIYRDGISKGTGETVTLDKGIYYYILNTTGGANWTANSSLDAQTLIIKNITLTINSVTSNLSAELGMSILINATSNYDYIYIDVDHPSYGTNYSIGLFKTGFDLIIDWFRKTAFNDSTISKELEYTGTEIKTVYFSSHQYDEIVNMSINISGTNTTQYPENVLINSSNTSTIDRYFPGSLIGNNIFLDKDANNDSTINLTYTNIAPQTINMFMDDNAILKFFTFNITGIEFGVDFIDYLTNLSYINIISSDGQINDAGVIMSANSTLKNLLWDDFDDSNADSNKWDISADFSQSTGGGIDCGIERHVTEGSGEIRIRAENNHIGSGITGCDSGSSYIVTNLSHFNLYNTDNIIVKMNSSTVTESDGGDCDGAVYVYLGNTEVWQGNPLFETGGLSRSDAKIIFNFTKINSTSWSAHLTGYESRTRGFIDSDLRNWTNSSWTRTNGTVQSLTNPFIVEVTYFSNIPLGLLAEDDASDVNCKYSYSNAYFDYVNNSLWSRNNGSIISESVYDSSGTITDATFNTTRFSVANNETVNLFMSANDGDNWEVVTNGLEHSFVNTGSHLKWKIDFNMTETGYKNISSYVSDINITTPKGYPINVSIDFGNDGIADFSFSGSLNNTNSPMLVDVSSADISTSLLLAPNTGNHLNIIPLKITSASVGQINIDSINMTYNPNPVFLDTSAIYNFINSSIGFIDFPISIESIGGNITVNDVRFDYAGGNDTIKITAHDNDSSVNITRNITYYYSRWDYEWGPSGVEWIYFSPSTPTSANVTPYGQSSNTPILNITNYGYGGKNATLSIYQNDSSGCVNTTISLNNSKEYGFLLEESFIDIANLSYLDNASIYLWSDYNCSYDTWNLFEPQYYFRQCVDGGICSTELI